MESLLNESGAARLLGIAKITLRNWRRQGKAPRHVQIGRTIRYTPAALEEFVQSKLARR